MDVSVWMNQSVYWAQKTGVSSSGDPTFAAAVALQARVTLEPKLKRHGADGSELISGTLIDVLQQVSPEDRFWMPGDAPSDVNGSRTPMDVTAIVDENGSTLYWHLLF
jgi:hypothetical protein